MEAAHISAFLKTRTSKDSQEIYENLRKISPKILSDSKFKDLIAWIENNNTAHKYPFEHYNIFGTGGDFSLNISTMAAILASRFFCIKKVGTSAVNSKFGASDFYKEISSRSEKYDLLRGTSEYISLGEIGFDYKPELKKARQLLHKRNELDIYKVIFPISNYTNAWGQVNGVCNHEYFEIYKRLSVQLKRNSWVVISEYGFDEIMAGNNRLARVENGKSKEFEYFVPQTSKLIPELTMEKDNLSQHVAVFSQVLDGTAHPDLIESILYNSALLLSFSMQNETLEQIANKVKKKMYEFA